MTELETLTAILQSVNFLGETIALGIGIMWGAYSWRLVLLAKNQSRLW